MSNNYKYLKHALLGFTFFANSYALPATLLESDEILVAPKCFLAANDLQHNDLAYNETNDMVLFSVDRQYLWTKIDSIKHQATCGKFVNVNDAWQDYLTTQKLNSSRISVVDFHYFLSLYLSDNTKSSSFPTHHLAADKQDAHDDLLQKLYSNLNPQRMWNSLDELTSYYDRAAFSDTGFEAAGHIKQWMETLAATSGLSDNDFSVKFVTTNSFYRQPSVVAVLGRHLPGKALVIGAHMDTTGNGRRPGADDDGAGSMVVLEAARLLASSGYKFDRPIYFVWYAAEEVGLVGSKKVVQDMRRNHVEVDSVLQFDVVGMRPKADDATIWLLKDHVNLEFTDYIATLLKDKVKVPVSYTQCGYACSDHASWNDEGFTVAAPTESSFHEANPHMHTANDTKEHLSEDHIMNMIKLVLAYVVDRAA